MAETIYYDVGTDIAYRSDNSQAVNDNILEFQYRLEQTVNIQLLASNSVDANGDFDDFYTALAATASTATAAIDNDAVHYEDGTVSSPAITGGVSIATIKVAGLSATPRIAGRLKLTNAAGQTETINYYGYSLASEIYTFTLANINYVAGNQTPTYSYAIGDTVRVLQLPIVKDSSVDCTDKATGLFVATMDCNSVIFQELIEGSVEIASCKLELTVFDATSKRILAKKFAVKCLYLLDDDGGVAPAPSIAGGDLTFLDPNNGIILVDRTTAIHYRFFVDNAIIGIESVS